MVLKRGVLFLWISNNCWATIKETKRKRGNWLGGEGLGMRRRTADEDGGGGGTREKCSCLIPDNMRGW